MEENQNNAPPNTPPSNIIPGLGFGAYLTGYGEFTSMLMGSPTIPNQRQFPQTASPPIHFPNVQHNVFNHNIQQAHYQQNFGGGSSSSIPPFQTQVQTQEFVQETQMEAPVPTTQKNPTQKKKTSRPKKGKTQAAEIGPKPWTPDEYVRLAEAWCATSKDGIRGNDQSAKTYWNTIRLKYQRLAGLPEDYRGTDAVSSKWSDLKRKVTTFNGIHNRIKNSKPSGWTEMNVLDAAKNEYHQTVKQPFTLERVWYTVRNDPKWSNVEPLDTRTRESSSSKRSRGASSVDVSDGHVNIDLNAGSDAFAVDDDDVEPSSSHPLARPKAGRDKLKRIAKFGDAKEKKEKDKEEIRAELKEHLRLSRERKEMETKRRQEEAEAAASQQLLTHLSILEKKGDNVDPSDRDLVNEAKSKSRSWISKFLGK